MPKVYPRTIDLNDQGEAGRYVVDMTADSFVYCSMQGVSETGTWSTANVELEVSNDGRVWFQHPGGEVKLTGEGITSKVDIRAFAYVRAYVETLQGAGATASITLVFTTSGDS